MMGQFLILSLLGFFLSKAWKALDEKETPEEKLVANIAMKNKVVPYFSYIFPFARPAGLTGNESYIMGMIAQESAGDPKATGSIGERGLMQITIPALKDVNDLTGAELLWSDMWKVGPNLKAGILYLGIQKTRMKGDLFKAIQAYNAGAGAVNRNPRAGLDYLERVKKWREVFKSYDR